VTIRMTATHQSFLFNCFSCHRASGRAFQAAKNQDDYFSDSPPYSPDDGEGEVGLLFRPPHSVEGILLFSRTFFGGWRRL